MITQIQQPIPAFTPKQIYALEQSWFEAGNHSFGLMQQAAWSASQWLIHAINLKTSMGLSVRASFCKPVCKDHALCVVVGGGNNGGDGWLIAKYLHDAGYAVTVYAALEPKTEDAKSACAAAKQAGVEVTGKNSPLPLAHLYVDALFGIGLNTKPEGDWARIIQDINQQKAVFGARVVAVDIPSGLNATTGMVYDGVAIDADETLCFLAYKTGLLTANAPDYVGEVHLLPLMPLPSHVQPAAFVHKDAPTLPKRRKQTHKGSYGHVLVIGGNKTSNPAAPDQPKSGMGGAAILAAQAAFKVGAGKVSVACHANFHGALLARCPHAMTLDLHCQASVKAMVKTCDVVVLGMGLGRDTTAFELFKNHMSYALEAGKTVILDADALYHLHNLTDFTKLKHQANVWYTPHSGEAARLLDMSVRQIEEDRYAAVERLATIYGGSWLLKGAGSLVYQDGSTHVSTLGNAGMATAGMGDVLSGMAAGLRAQKHLNASLLDAVLLHASLGDEVARQFGEYGLSAADMV